MKNRIIISKKPDLIEFYRVGAKGTQWLFSQKFTSGVYKYFENGRMESEILEFSRWGRNPRLDKTIERIPRQITYLEKYAG